MTDWVKSKQWRKKSLIVSPIVSLLVYFVLLRPFLPEPEIGDWAEVALACVVGWVVALAVSKWFRRGA